MLQQKISDDIQQAIQALQSSGQWPAFVVPEIRVDLSEQTSHGDFASNVAMQLTGQLRKSPLEVASELKDQLKGSYDQVQIVHPGFINFFLSGEQYAAEAAEILAAGDRFGSSGIGAGQKVVLEFISANPTGPLTLPNGRGGYLGDVLANVLTMVGYEAIREYYVNDRGNQIDILGESVARRYLMNNGLNVPYPENLYQGDYINDLANQLELKNYKLQNLRKIEWIRDRIKEKALSLMLAEIKRVIAEKMGISYDTWVSERWLYANGFADFAMEKLMVEGYVYSQEGATWLRTTAAGDDKDRVLVKSSGEGAYMQGDAALFYERAFRRKVSKVILILGADHHGYEKRLKALPRMMGASTVFDIIFIQLATLSRAGQEVRMSKRKGNFVTIEELIDEVGPDVSRFFFLMYSADRQMHFDLDLAKERSEKNPVFYVQYAYARICSILRETGLVSGSSAKAGELVVEHEAERALVRMLGQFPELVLQTAADYEVHRLPNYALDLARSFHHFYGHCRVIENGEGNHSRLQLVEATKLVLEKTLGLLGVTAPEKM